MIGSTLAHATIVGLVLLVPLLYLAEELPTPPDMLAFVVATPPPPPPPPPPPAAHRAEPVKPKAVLKAESAIAAPVEAPAEILPERPVMLLEPEFGEGGVEGGVVGGIAGGIARGIPMMPAPPPPPPPAPTPMKPVRVGGDIEQPSLLHRVSPEYPQIALARRKKGS